MHNKINKNNILFDYRKWLTLVMVITVVQQFFIKDVSIYNGIRIFLYLLLSLLTLISLMKSTNFKKYKFISFFIIVIYLMSFIFCIFSFMSSQIMIGNILELLIPTGLLICSTKAKFYYRQLRRFENVYIILSVVLVTYIIFKYGNGYTIGEQYFFANKNQIGPICGISAIILIHNMVYAKKTYFNNNLVDKLLCIIMIIILIISLLVLRNRATMVALMIVLIFMSISSWKKDTIPKKSIIILGFLIIIAILSVTHKIDGILLFIRNSFTLSYDINDINSLSAGRTDVYIESLEYIKKSFVFGKIVLPSFMENPHHFVLYRWVEYGVVGSLPLIILYLYLWMFTINKLIKKDNEKNNLGLWLLLFALITSNFEYAHPFGPGISQILVWFFVGQYLITEKNQDIKEV